MTTQPERLHHLLDRAEVATVRATRAEARVRELEANVRTLQDALGAVTGQCRAAEHHARKAEATVARVRQAVDAGPVGSCCAHLIRAALNPPPAVKRCGCGRPDPGPCQPCPDNSPSLHCACDCEPTQGAA
ncbi:hypothetical protein [Streptomyces badius]